jgi:large subunit ribosomal protein L29
LPFIRLKTIRDMDSGEREAKLRELQVELSKLRALIRAGGSLENPSRVKELRKAVARILTIQREEKAEREGKR